jgi:hypothetical protein
LLHAATELLSADNVSLWQLRRVAICPIAIGDGAGQLVGRRADAEAIANRLEGEDVLASSRYLSHSGTKPAPSVPRATWRRADRIRLPSVRRSNDLPARRRVANAREVASNDRARDLALVMEMSREMLRR